MPAGFHRRALWRGMYPDFFDAALPEQPDPRVPSARRKALGKRCVGLPRPRPGDFHGERKLLRLTCALRRATSVRAEYWRDNITFARAGRLPLVAHWDQAFGPRRAVY